MIYANCRFGIIFCLMTVVIMLLAMSGCSSYGYNDPFFGRDKLYHFTASGVIGAGTTMASSLNGILDRDAALIGISVAMSFGSGKECYDMNVKGTFWSWKDMFWDLMGGVTGSYLAAE